MPPWYLYVARCSDATLYIGIALDVAARIAAHDAGRGARYTRGRAPLSVLATRRCKTKGDALRLELAMKRLSRDEKLRLVSSPRNLAAFARQATAPKPSTKKQPTSNVPRSPSAPSGVRRASRRRPP